MFYSFKHYFPKILVLGTPRTEKQKRETTAHPLITGKLGKGYDWLSLIGLKPLDHLIGFMASAARPDFTGKWQLDRSEGFDDYLKAT